MKSKAEKRVQMDEIKAVLEGAKSAVFVDFSGLTVAEDTQLRRQVREAGATYTVYKNTLIAIVAKELGIEGLDEFLSKNTAICASADDAVAPCKVICEFAKEHKQVEVKTGIMSGAIISVEEVKAIAELPPKEVLVAKMLGSLNAPISGFVRVLDGTLSKVVYALNAIKDQKESA